MKYYCIVAILMLFSCNSQSQEKKSNTETELTTYYLIRHAEKDRSDPNNNNPHLNEKGMKRAEKWNQYLDNVKFDAVYSTDYFRTMETAQPIAHKNNVTIKTYDPSELNKEVDSIRKDTKGKTVLIVGHSNTTPSFVNALIGKKSYDDIDDNINGNLYIVTIDGDKVEDKVLTIN